MTRGDVLTKLISIRHHCFLHGVLGTRSFDRKTDEPAQDDFRHAFRTLNRLYADLRDHPEGHSDATKSPAVRRSSRAFVRSRPTADFVISPAASTVSDSRARD
jgi:hypothetical protein